MTNVALNQEPSGEYDFSIVNNDQLILIWEGAKKYLEKSCKRSNGRIRPEDIFYDCLNGSHRLWIIYDTGSFDIRGIVVTQKIFYPTGKTMLSLEHITGNNMEDWVEMLIEQLEVVGKRDGCDGIEGIGRAGFWNWIKNKDWKKLAVFFEYNFEVKDEKI